MVSKKSRSEVRMKKHRRMRNRFSGTAERPRLAVFRSNNHMYAQIIDDTVGIQLFPRLHFRRMLRLSWKKPITWKQQRIWEP